MSDINIAETIPSTILPGLPVHGSYQGEWDIPLNRILTNINTYLNSIKNHTAHANESDISIGEIFFNGKANLKVNLGAELGKRYIVLTEDDNANYSTLELTRDDQLSLKGSKDNGECKIHYHIGSKDQWFKVSNPEIGQDLSNASNIKDNGTLDKAIPYYLFYYSLGHTEAITEDGIKSLQNITVPEYDINLLLNFATIYTADSQETKISKQAILDKISLLRDTIQKSTSKKTILNYLNFFNTYKAFVNGDSEQEFNVKAPQDDTTIDYQTEDVTFSPEKNADIRYNFSRKDNWAVPYRYAEKRYYRGPATTTSLGTIIVGKGLSIKDGILSIQDPTGLLPPSNLRAVQGASETDIILSFDLSVFEGVTGDLTSIKYNIYWAKVSGVNANNKLAERNGISFGNLPDGQVGISDLEEGTRYYFSVAAYSKAFPELVYSEEVSFKTGISAPGQFTAYLDNGNSTPTSLKLTWDPSVGATSYNILYSKTKADVLASSVKATSQQREATITGLDPNTTYFLAVQAVKTGAKSVYTNIVEGTTKSPYPTAVTFKAEATGTTKIKISLTEEPNLIYYYVYGKTENGDLVIGSTHSALGPSPMTLGESTDPLVPNTQYTVGVYAKNIDGVYSPLVTRTVKTWTASTQRFDYSSEITKWQMPNNTNGNLQIECFGGGGGGAGAGVLWWDINNSRVFINTWIGGGSGGGGAMGKTILTGLKGGEEFSVTVGKAGTAGRSNYVTSGFTEDNDYVGYIGTNGGDGGDSFVKSQSGTVLAQGGGGKGGIAASGVGGDGFNVSNPGPGIGGIGIGSTSQINGDDGFAGATKEIVNLGGASVIPGGNGGSAVTQATAGGAGYVILTWGVEVN